MIGWFRRRAAAPLRTEGQRPLTFGEGMSLLPWRDRWFAYYLIGCATAPLLASLYASLPSAEEQSAAFLVGPAILFMGSRPWLAGALALAAGATGVLVWERPGSGGWRGYAAQLRARLLAVQAARDAEFRRRYSHEEGPTHVVPDQQVP